MKKKYLPVIWSVDGWLLHADGNTRIVDLINIKVKNEKEKQEIEEKFDILTINERINQLET